MHLQLFQAKVTVDGCAVSICVYFGCDLHFKKSPFLKIKLFHYLLGKLPIIGAGGIQGGHEGSISVVQEPAGLQALDLNGRSVLRVS